MPVYKLDEHQPLIDSEHWIAPDAHVIGKVRLGKNVGIWFGAILRGDNELIDIGAGSNIQEHSMLHTDIGFPLAIGTNCTIGHHAILHGCIIGDGSLIGMGATLLNGSKIGAGSIVGANALVTEGKEFPDGSLIVGSPAKVVRLLSDEDRLKIIASAEAYVKNWQRFKYGLKQVS